MVSRRKLLVGFSLGTISAALPALAQQSKLRRIEFLGGTNAKTMTIWLAAFRDGMTALGWVEGRDYKIDAHSANSVSQVHANLAEEVITAQPDLLLVAGDTSISMLAQRTKIIPIVFAVGSDPVGLGVAASLRHPGGNVTGLTTLARDLGAKRLQLLKETFPRIAHVVVLFGKDAIGLIQVKEVEAAALRLTMRVTPIELRDAASIEPAFKRGAALGAQAFVMTQSFLINNERQSIVERLLRSKVPAIYATENVESGELMSYGPSFTDNFRRAATYVDKIFKGAKPGDLPIEQPTKFELVVNMKTAKMMGFTIPQSVLVQADRVIE